jgi:hypothetical protein
LIEGFRQFDLASAPRRVEAGAAAGEALAHIDAVVAVADQAVDFGEVGAIGC